jgi:hypothetical protein
MSGAAERRGDPVPGTTLLGMMIEVVRDIDVAGAMAARDRRHEVERSIGDARGKEGIVTVIVDDHMARAASQQRRHDPRGREPRQHRHPLRQEQKQHCDENGDQRATVRAMAQAPGCIACSLHSYALRALARARLRATPHGVSQHGAVVAAAGGSHCWPWIRCSIRTIRRQKLDGRSIETGRRRGGRPQPF